MTALEGEQYIQEITSSLISKNIQYNKEKMICTYGEQIKVQSRIKFYSMIHN